MIQSNPLDLPEPAKAVDLGKLARLDAIDAELARAETYADVRALAAAVRRLLREVAT